MNALPITPIAETADSVTLSRADFEALADLVTDAQDLADAEAVKARLAAGETEAFPFEVAERILEGERPERGGALPGAGDHLRDALHATGVLQQVALGGAGGVFGALHLGLFGRGWRIAFPP